MPTTILRYHHVNYGISRAKVDAARRFYGELLGLIERETFSGGEDPTLMLARVMNVWVRGAGTTVACLMLLGVAAHAEPGASRLDQKISLTRRRS